MAEILPFVPDPGHTGVGKQRFYTMLGVIYSRFSSTGKRLFLFIQQLDHHKSAGIETKNLYHSVIKEQIFVLEIYNTRERRV